MALSQCLVNNLGPPATRRVGGWPELTSPTCRHDDPHEPMTALYEGRCWWIDWILYRAIFQSTICRIILINPFNIYYTIPFYRNICQPGNAGLLCWRLVSYLYVWLAYPLVRPSALSQSDCCIALPWLQKSFGGSRTIEGTAIRPGGILDRDTPWLWKKLHVSKVGSISQSQPNESFSYNNVLHRNALL